jgi:hypothetical protein
LIRLVGKENSLTGEIMLSPGEGGSWLLESLTLGAEETGVSSGFDPLTYKRFL